MTAIHWLNPISGGFTNASGWSGGVVPGSSDSAILDPVGAAFTVTSGMSVGIESLELASNADLAITGGTFTVSNGVDNAGQITVGGTGTFSMSGVLDNTGTVSLLHQNNYSILLATSDVTLSGGGVIADDGEINTPDTAIRITNIDDTIAGNGYIESASRTGFVFVNKAKGVVDCTRQGYFSINYENPGAVVNSGTLEATAGILYISQSKITGSGSHTGLIAAAEGATVIVTEGSTVSGQRFSVAAGGALNLSDSTVSYAGSIKNAGTLDLGAKVTLLGATTISGGGTVQLYGTIGGAADDILVNADNTLTGGGQLGNGQIAVVNQAAGVIDGDGLTINCGGQAFANAGLAQAAGRHSVLIVTSAVDNTGKIANTNKKGSVTLESEVVNNGVLSAIRGLLTVDGAVSGSGSAQIANGTLEFLSTFSQSVTFSAGVGVLMLARSQSYGGTVTGFAPYSSLLDLGDIGFVDKSEATFSGSGTSGVLTVSDGTHTANITLDGDYLGLTFVASSNGKGGVDIVATSGQVPSAAHFAGAMAAVTGDGMAAGPIHARMINGSRQMMLAAPRLALA